MEGTCSRKEKLFFMAKKPSSIPVLTPLYKEKPLAPVAASLQTSKNPTRQWLLFSVLLIVGVMILSSVSYAAWGWLKNIKIPTNPTSAPLSSQTFNVQRTADYAGLQYTVVNIQYATSFADDGIHPGSAVVRVNMNVANKTSEQISVIYYDIARLLAPHISALNPTNVSLSVGPKPGTSETGWIDFSAPAGLQLSALKLQLGSTQLGEYLVTIPFTGKFNPNDYTDRISTQNLDFNYYFPYNAPHLLTYHLSSVDIRDAYQGAQTKAGQQFYVLNFRVSNPNGIAVAPGFGYDYIRISFNGGPIHPPVDNTLPYTFNAGAKPVGGRVVFTGPAGIKAFTIDFLVQYGSGGTEYTVSL
jgi:hypothetical protein